MVCEKIILKSPICRLAKHTDEGEGNICKSGKEREQYCKTPHSSTQSNFEALHTLFDPCKYHIEAQNFDKHLYGLAHWNY